MNINNDMRSMVDWAQQYAARGWHVFPVPPGTKKSHKSAAHSDGRRWGATTDPDEIARDWARWPEANIGIVCGPTSGLFVVEADTLSAHGTDGVGNLTERIEKNGGLPHTIEAESPSGSWHLYFTWPEGETIINSTGTVAPGVDVRGAGGMVVAPPSVRGDACYSWRNPPGFFELADCPDWLLALCRKPARSGREFDTGRSAAGFGEAGPDEVSEALTYVDPDMAYSEWLAVLMAIHDHLGDAGLGIAEEWSARGAKYESGCVTSRWGGFTAGGGHSIAYVFHLARQGGCDLGALARKHRQPPGAKQAGSRPRDDKRTDDDKPPEHVGVAPEFSDEALALKFAEQRQDQLRYVAAWSKWLIWSGKHWEQDDTLLAFNHARAVCREAVAACKSNSGSTETRIASAKTVAAVASLVRSDRRLAATVDQWDADTWLLNTPSGIVDLKSGTIRAHRPDDYMTKSPAARPSNRPRKD